MSLASPDPPLPACRLPRFPAGPFRSAARQTLTEHGNAALSALYTVANELAVLAESTTDPMLRGRALGEYGKLCFGIVRLSVGIAHTVEAAHGGQESLIPWAGYPPAIRDAFDALVTTAERHGVDIAALWRAGLGDRRPVD
jgi:hypothetical protein